MNAIVHTNMMHTFLPEPVREALQGFFLEVHTSWFFFHAPALFYIGILVGFAVVLVVRPKPRGALAIALFAFMLLALLILDLSGAIPKESSLAWNTGILCALGLATAGVVALADTFIRKLPWRALVAPTLCVISSLMMYVFMVTVLIANYGH